MSLANSFNTNETPIEHLILQKDEIDDASIFGLSLLKQIKKLELYAGINEITDARMIQLSQALTELEELDLGGFKHKHFSTVTIEKVVSSLIKLSTLILRATYSYWNIGEAEYNTLLQHVKYRSEKKSIKIEMGVCSEIHLPDQIMRKYLANTITLTFDPTPKKNIFSDSSN